MSETLVAALIGAVAIVFAAVIAAVATARSTRFRNRLEIEQQRAGQTLQNRSFSKYGLRASRAVSTWRVLDTTSTLVRTQRIDNLRADEGVSLSYIRGRSWHSAPGASLRTPPRLVHVSDFPKQIALENESDSIENCVYRLLVTGSLDSGDPPLSYTVETVYDHAILLSNEAVARAYAGDDFKNDYVAWEAELPVDAIELSVEFPAGIKAKCYPGVFWGPSEWFFHNQELKRVRDGFLLCESGARFRIDKPVIGFRYFIYWTFA